jgi:Fe-S cluster biogenesis protein NfuA
MADGQPWRQGEDITMSSAEDGEFRQRMQRIELLTQQLASCTDPVLRAASQELVGSLLEMHGVALARMFDRLDRAGEVGRDLMNAFARDGLLSSLLLLHGLHPDDLQTRVRRALDRVRPVLHSHQGDVELLDVSDGVVRLRVHGACNGRESSSAGLEQIIQEAVIDAAPDLVALEVEGGSPPPSASALYSLPLLNHPIRE